MAIVLIDQPDGFRVMDGDKFIAHIKARYPEDRRHPVHDKFGSVTVYVPLPSNQWEVRFHAGIATVDEIKAIAAVVPETVTLYDPHVMDKK